MAGSRVFLLFFLLSVLVFKQNNLFAQSFEKRTVEYDFRAFFIQAFDLNRDGSPDILSGRHQLAWWRNDGSGNFSQQFIDYGSLTRLFSIFPVDLDRDGDYDLLTCDIESDVITVYINSNENFSRVEIINNFPRAESVVAADFDKDGDIDVAAVSLETAYVTWWKNDGNMNFNTRIDLDNTNNRGHKIAVVDLDGDGWKDLLTVAASEAGLVWWRNNGSDYFSKNQLSGEGGLGIYADDLDGNGSEDIILCLHSQRTVLLLLNSGSGSFSEVVLADDLEWPGWGVSGDLNNDGRKDIVVVESGRSKEGVMGKIIWFKNTGGMDFSRHVINSSIDSPFMADLADFNGDGKLDVLSSSEHDRQIWWWKNQSSSSPPKILTLQSPDGGEVINGGDGYDISWTSSGNIYDVRIQFSQDNGNNWQEITSSTTNDGYYYWQTPLVNSDLCLIRISEAGNDNLSDESDGLFSINYSLAQIITVESPNGGEVFNGGSQYGISWTWTGDINTVRLQYSTDDGNNWQEITSSTTNDGYYYWQAPLLDSDRCLVRISEAGNDNLSDVSDNVFSIFSTSPKILTVESPNGGEVFYVGDICEIRWTWSGDINNVQILYTADGNVWGQIAQSTVNDGFFSWEIPEPGSDQYLIKILDINEEAIFDISDNPFVILNPVPLSVISPNGNENWASGSDHVILWVVDTRIEMVKIEYSFDGGVWITVTETANEGNYVWHLPNIISNSCLIRISESTNSSNMDLSDAVFSIIEMKDAGYALSFDGVSQVANIPDNPILSGGAGQNFTFEAWIKLDSVSGDHPIVSKFLDKSWKDWGMQVRNGEIKIAIENNGDNWEYGAGNITPGVWTHVAFSFNNDVDSVRIFINGYEVGEAAFQPNDMADTDAPVLLGAHIYSGAYMSGLLDEVRIWNIVRNGETIRNDMNRFLSGQIPGLIGYWRFDEGFGSVSSNIAGNDNHVQFGNTDNQPGNYPLWVVSDAPIYQDPSLKIISPNGGEIFTAGDVVPIIWSWTGNITSVKLEYSSSQQPGWLTVSADTENDGLFDWLLPPINSDYCLLRISSNNNIHSDTSDYYFVIDNNQISISGLVKYYMNNKPIQSVSMSLFNGFFVDDTTGLDGTFFFPMIPKDTYTLVPGMENENHLPSNIISSYDAAITARHAVKIEELSPLQQIAADINNDGQILSFDAAMISRYVVILPALDGTFAGNWNFLPDTVILNSMENDAAGIIFTGLIKGDVDGNWDNGNLQKANKSTGPLGKNSMLDQIIQNGDTTKIIFKLPGNQDVISFDILISFSDQEYKFLSSPVTPSGSGLNILSNYSSSLLHVGGYTINYLLEDYQVDVTLLRLNSESTGSIFLNKFIINNQIIESDVSLDIISSVNSEELPRSFQVIQNYPNPFNDVTQLSFYVPEPLAGEVVIYNLSGEIVKTLYSGNFNKGEHVVIWNGTDENKNIVSSGMYIVRVILGERLRTLKILYIR